MASVKEDFQKVACTKNLVKKTLLANYIIEVNNKNARDISRGYWLSLFIISVIVSATNKQGEFLGILVG